MRSTFIFAFLFGSVVLSTGCSRTKDDGERDTSVIIYRNAEGRTITKKELQGVSGSFNYEILGAENVPAEAMELHKRARDAGQRGEYEAAIALLTQASDVAPKWPYPVYDKAYTFLLMKDFQAARTYYRMTVALSPRGFFTAVTASDVLAREANGEFPPGTYLAYLSLEWLNDPTQKADMTRQLVKHVPRLAPAWMEMAIIADQDSERLAAIEHGLAANPDAETLGLLQINKALVLNRQGHRDSAVRLLGELALDPRSTYGTEHIAKATLAMLCDM